MRRGRFSLRSSIISQGELSWTVGDIQGQGRSKTLRSNIIGQGELSRTAEDIQGQMSARHQSRKVKDNKVKYRQSRWVELNSWRRSRSGTWAQWQQRCESSFNSFPPCLASSSDWRKTPIYLLTASSSDWRKTPIYLLTYCLFQWLV